MGRTRFFISHSSDDGALHDSFYRLLTDGFGIDKNEIFTTSKAGALQTGEYFTETIKKRLQESEIVFLLMTKAYSQSPFCFSELGAAWVLEKKIIPILTESISKEIYDRTPLLGKQYKLLDDANIGKRIREIYDELHREGCIETQNTEDFENAKDVFVDTVRRSSTDSNHQYVVRILEEREVPYNRRCYRIDKLVSWPGIDQPISGESHWLIYYRHEFNGLKLEIGDKVEITVNKVTPLTKRWRDGLTNTRNIGVSSIKVLSRG